MPRTSPSHNSDNGPFPEFVALTKKQFGYTERALHGAALLGGGSSGPQPAPEWLITDGDAVDEKLGILKTGKEAVVWLMERTHGDRAHLYARKTYRDPERRAFKQDTGYRTQRSRGGRSADLLRASGSRGDAVRAAEWRGNEFRVLSRLYEQGLRVPYPIELVDEHLHLEYVGSVDSAAPRLVECRPEPAELEDLWQQAIRGLELIVQTGYVHGDLSPYNLLVRDGELWFIDFPQSATIAQSPDWVQLLARDVDNVSRWFSARGLAVDAGEMLARLL